jgi:hypothetical protein
MALLNQGIRVGAAWRAYPGESACGDTWLADWPSAGACRLAVIDGVGHGTEAKECADLCREVLASHPDMTPAEATVACHRALLGTRGAVMTIARIEPGAQSMRVAGVGNVGMLLMTDGREQHFIAQRGMLGSNVPTIRAVDFQLGSSWVVALHTDGVRSHFRLPPVLGDCGDSADSLAEHILLGHRRPEDDALVLIAAFP